MLGTLHPVLHNASPQTHLLPPPTQYSPLLYVCNITNQVSHTLAHTKAMRPFSAALGFLLLLLTSSHLQAAMAGSGFCSGKCKVRCSKASVQDRCLRYCGMCCQQCSCVPSGTYGNKDECPCYRDMYTGVGRKRRPKCP